MHGADPAGLGNLNAEMPTYPTGPDLQHPQAAAGRCYVGGGWWVGCAMIDRPGAFFGSRSRDWFGVKTRPPGEV